MIDLRSDTVTQPTQSMREAMMQAKVGDDVFGEDPSINQLEKYVAELFGKEVAMFCASGTQTNQIAIKVHTQPGAEVICHRESHIYKYEGGGIAVNSGASVRLLTGNRGRISHADIQENVNNPEDIHLPLTQLVSIEDTANRGGGAVYEYSEILAIRSVCNKLGIPLHLDGARVFNALRVNQISCHEYGQNFDSISICLSKGLGAPVGSVLIGSESFIHKARRVRKVLGGGMRQAGMLAAAGLFALENHVERLSIDHDHAKMIEAVLQDLSWVDSVLPVETNIVVAMLNKESERDEILATLKQNGILAIAFGPGMIRFVTHLDVHTADIERCCEILKSLRNH